MLSNGAARMRSVLVRLAEINAMRKDNPCSRASSAPIGGLFERAVSARVSRADEQWNTPRAGTQHGREIMP
jgi:hypothetical protein